MSTSCVLVAAFSVGDSFAHFIFPSDTLRLFQTAAVHCCRGCLIRFVWAVTGSRTVFLYPVSFALDFVLSLSASISVSLSLSLLCSPTTAVAKHRADGGAGGPNPRLHLERDQHVCRRRPSHRPTCGRSRGRRRRRRKRQRQRRGVIFAKESQGPHP